MHFEIILLFPFGKNLKFVDCTACCLQFKCNNYYWKLNITSYCLQYYGVILGHLILLYSTPLGFMLGQLKSHSLGSHWVSIISFLGLYWASIIPFLGLCWVSLIPFLGLHWVSIIPYLGSLASE